MILLILYMGQYDFINFNDVLISLKIILFMFYQNPNVSSNSVYIGVFPIRSVHLFSTINFSQNTVQKLEFFKNRPKQKMITNQEDFVSDNKYTRDICIPVCHSLAKSFSPSLNFFPVFQLFFTCFLRFSSVFYPFSPVFGVFFRTEKNS